ncbi:MAG: FAD-dependent 5-carboxymethylaminomethyl-2-thiouridine(34) oxidoreductase MnmC [Methylotenera sp.]|nr:FAD-dependent 5-carboxymethylaminomethyl-2-thiouridine(34) oxidoreductase MnmC [Methylotenera sp.]
MATSTAIVIGGGIAGCSTAFALAKRGLKITLIERNASIASAASGNPLAMLYPRLGGDVISSQFALATYTHSLALFQSLNLPQADFNQCGMLQLGFNTRELTRIQKVALQSHPEHILKFVNRHQASALAGIELTHDALYFPGAGWVNPKALCNRLTQHPNINIQTSQAVTAVSQNKCQLMNHHGSQTLTADIIVIANANDAQQLLPDIPLNIHVVRGQVSLIKATTTSRALNTILCSDGYLSPARYLHQEIAQHCLGATFSTEQTHSLAVNADDHDKNLEKLKHLSLALHEDLQHKVTDGRASLRCRAIDYWPLAGQLLDASRLRATPPRPSASVECLPWVGGLYLNIAHGSKGFSTAPLCAELIAQQIFNEPSAIHSEFTGWLNPNRFLLRDLGLKRLAKMR